MPNQTYDDYYVLAARESERAFSPTVWRKRAPHAVPLSAGFPFPASFPTAEMAAATAAVLEREGTMAMQYGGGPALSGLTEYLKARMQSQGLLEYPTDLLVTAGSGQAIDIALRLFLTPTDWIAVEGPTFMGAHFIIANFTRNVLTVPMDADGCDVDQFEALLAGRRRSGEPLPKLFYTIPTFQNPTGVTMTLERRQRLMRLAEEYDFLIIEDDAYGSLGFDAAPPPTLRSMDEGGRVLYISTLSKLLGPGVRVGWVVAHPSLISKMARLKSDGTHPFSHSACYEYLQGIDLEARIRWLRQEYHQRCEAMLGALERYMPPGCTWSAPGGGFFLWVTLPEGIDTTALLEQANEAGVTYIPGQAFYVDGAGSNSLRLSFSFPAPAEIDRGIRILGDLVKTARPTES